MSRSPVATAALAALLFILPALGAGFSPGQLAAPAPPVVAPPHNQAAPSGRIPVSGPIQITVPGYYYLTANLIAPPDAGAVSIVTKGVILDLNGHTVTGRIGVGNVYGETAEATIKNGFIEGGIGARWCSLRIENVSIRQIPGETWGNISATQVDHVEIIGSSFYADSADTVIQATSVHRFTMRDSTVELEKDGSAVSLYGVYSGLIEGSELLVAKQCHVGPNFDPYVLALDLRAAGIVVRGNVFHSGMALTCQGWGAHAGGILVRPIGLDRPSSNHLIEGNNFSGFTTEAILVDVAIHGVVLRGNTGMHQQLRIDGSGNAYRDNVMTIIDQGSNINGGGNLQ